MTIENIGQWQKRQAQKRDRRQRRKKNQRQNRTMSDAARLYQAVLSNLVKFLPAMKAENFLTLAMMITGLLKSKSGQFSKMARAVQYAAKHDD